MKERFGLSTKEIEIMYSIFKKFNGIKSVIIFGSRAKGKQKKCSDIDLALNGDINFNIVAKVKYLLEEDTTLPYFFDVLDYNSISDSLLKKEVEIGKIFYEKKQQKKATK
ncbi:nucleotidyltransferase domain-containing protein [bacterium]